MDQSLEQESDLIANLNGISNQMAAVSIQPIDPTNVDKKLINQQSCDAGSGDTTNHFVRDTASPALDTTRANSEQTANMIEQSSTNDSGAQETSRNKIMEENSNVSTAQPSENSRDNLVEQVSNVMDAIEQSLSETDEDEYDDEGEYEDEEEGEDEEWISDSDDSQYDGDYGEINGYCSDSEASLLEYDIDESLFNAVRKEKIESRTIRCIYKAKEDATHQCNVCLNAIVDEEEVRYLPCLHIFHTNCVDPWLHEKKRECPSCRMKIGKLVTTSDALQGTSRQ